MPMGPRRGPGPGPGRGMAMRRRRRRRRVLVGGMLAFGAYKMTQKQADQVQQHTGVDPEELTDQELAQAQDELGITKDPVTAADQDA
jgi:hypothetical protein